MLIIEIILTIVAWGRGWRWLSLIPLGSLMLLAILIGLSIPLALSNPLQFIWLDVLAIIALIIMIAQPRRKAPRVK